MRAPVRFQKRSLTINLDSTGIDSASEWLVANLAEGGAEKPDRLRMRLLLEEALLNMAEHFGSDAQATARLEKRQSRLRLRLMLEGERFNPLKPATTEAEDTDLPASLFSVIDLHVQYSYSKNVNVVRMSVPCSSVNPVLRIGIALLIGAFLGLLGNVMIPDAAQEAFSNTILNPIADMWVRLLQAISGPVIFLTALMATFDTKRIADLGGSRIASLARYFAITALVVLFTMACSLPLINLDIAVTEANGAFVSTALSNILQIVPSNLVEPFAQANTPQLLLIAIATGYLLDSMESRIGDLKALLQQLN